MKKIFIWEEISKLTSYHHSEGGLVIISDNLENAREFLRKEAALEVGALSESLSEKHYLYDTYGNKEEILKSFNNWMKKCDAFTSAPDFIKDIDCDEDKIFIFPNAGCC